MNGDGSDQPDWKAATKSIELLKKVSRTIATLFLATGLVRPHYPNVAPTQYFSAYPFKQMNLPFVPERRLERHAKGSYLGFQF